MSRIMACVAVFEDGGCHAKLRQSQQGAERYGAPLVERSKQYFAREMT